MHCLYYSSRVVNCTWLLQWEIMLGQLSVRYGQIGKARNNITNEISFGFASVGVMRDASCLHRFEMAATLQVGKQRVITG